jgi:hypothetical protein
VLLYLDTRDLIALSDNKSDAEREQFSAALARVGGELVYSLTNIMETCAPLRHVSPTANVMQRLNRLEQMPHRYLAEALIEPQELQEACDAFLSARSFIGRAPPLVPRFDYVISPFRPPATGSIVNYGLAQMVFDIWTANPSTMAGYANQGNRLRALMAADRARADYRQHRPNFQNAVARHLHQHRIAFPVDRIAEIAAWLQESAECCPAVKLGYEVYHALLKNVGDVPDNSDMPAPANTRRMWPNSMNNRRKSCIGGSRV